MKFLRSRQCQWGLYDGPDGTLPAFSSPLALRSRVRRQYYAAQAAQGVRMSNASTTRVVNYSPVHRGDRGADAVEDERYSTGDGELS